MSNAIQRLAELHAVPMNLTSPIDGDHAVIIAELAKSVMYWRGTDFVMPDELALRTARSHFAVVLDTMRHLGLTVARSTSTPTEATAGEG